MDRTWWPVVPKLGVIAEQISVTWATSEKLTSNNPNGTHMIFKIVLAAAFKYSFYYGILASRKIESSLFTSSLAGATLLAEMMSLICFLGSIPGLHLGRGAQLHQKTPPPRARPGA